MYQRLRASTQIRHRSRGDGNVLKVDRPAVPKPESTSYVDPVDGAGGENGIDADLQNEVDRAPFNLQNTMVEFQSCKFDNPQPFDLAVSWFKQH